MSESRTYTPAAATSPPTKDRKVNPFAGLDVMGFGPVPKASGEAKKVVEPTVPEDRKPLTPGESPWDPKMDPVRRRNIIGGWV